MTASRAGCWVAILGAIALLGGCDEPPPMWDRGDAGWVLPEWEPETGGDADADGDTATETDTTTDTDTDTGEEHLCDGQPETCEDIGPDEEQQYFGCCFGDTVYWCQDYGNEWLLVWKNCANQGLDCGFHEEQEFVWCV